MHVVNRIFAHEFRTLIILCTAPRPPWESIDAPPPRQTKAPLNSEEPKLNPKGIEWNIVGPKTEELSNQFLQSDCSQKR